MKQNFCTLATFSGIVIFLMNTILAQQPEFGAVEREKAKAKENSLFIGGLSPAVLAKDRTEINVFTSLNSYWWAIHQSYTASPVQDRIRETIFSTQLQAYRGLFEYGRMDVGIQMSYGRRRRDNHAASSPLDVFKGGNADDVVNGLDHSYSGLKDFGFRIRVVPFKRVPQLTINTGISFVLNKKSADAMEYLDAFRDVVDINLAYYVELNDYGTSYCFFSFNNTASFPGKLPAIKTNDQWLFNSTGSFYLVQRIGRFMIFPGLAYTMGYKQPVIQKEKLLIKTNEQLTGFLGFQYQFTPDHSISLFSGLPFLMESTHPLVKPVRESYSLFAIGGRFLF